MCGIAGILNLDHSVPPGDHALRGMLGRLRHRGPDEFGLYLGDDVALGSARLSIVDLAGGQQPISNEDGTLWIVFNGEIFNYVELRADLEKRGHRFATHSDTEVIVHLFEDYGVDAFTRLNGQWALALWDTRRRRLILSRDRLGVRPLFYSSLPSRLVFGSEIKAVLAHPSGGETRYDDLDALARATLGEAIPMAALFDWLRGRAWSGAPATDRADGAPGFAQLGWQISLQRWDEGVLEAVRALPPVITVRARVERPS